MLNTLGKRSVLLKVLWFYVEPYNRVFLYQNCLRLLFWMLRTQSFYPKKALKNPFSLRVWLLDIVRTVHPLCSCIRCLYCCMFQNLKHFPAWLKRIQNMYMNTRTLISETSQIKQLFCKLMSQINCRVLYKKKQQQKNIKANLS